jgi:hypothetical protein
MSDGAPRTLFAAIFVGLMPFLMGAAAFYFTSGVVVSCEPSGAERASCTESRRILGLIDIPLRRHPTVVGAAFDERPAYDEDGEPFTARFPVLLTPAGRQPLPPYGSGADLAGAVERLDAYAKSPEPLGLSVGGQVGGLSFFFHLFAGCFMFLGAWNFGSYLKSLIGGLRRSAAAAQGRGDYDPTTDPTWRL